MEWISLLKATGAFLISVVRNTAFWGLLTILLQTETLFVSRGGWAINKENLL